LNKEQYFFN